MKERHLLLSRTRIPEWVTEYVASTGALLELVECDASSHVEDHLGTTPVRVILFGFGADERLPSNWLQAFATREVIAIERVVVENGVCIGVVPHRPLANVRARTLSVFPGPMLPLSMGSHQRAFQLVAALGRAGHPVDLLVSGTKSEFLTYRDLLHQIAPRVHFYGNKKRKLPSWMRARKGLEKRWRRIHGQSGTGPDLFEERLANKATFSGMKALRRIVGGGAYDRVIINYAWLEPIRSLVPEAVSARIEWICDSHDVQYVRGRTANRGERRVGVLEKREREVELRVLRSFDKVLAISASDASELTSELGGERVLLLPTGFDYALQAPRAPSEPPVFGFIGGPMQANEKAVKKILTEWWPEIRRRLPNAQLRIAGGISTSPDVGRLAFLRDDVTLDGYVSSLSSWYSSIDVLLNPVVVQGGLNFKSVEALFSGRLLVTTSMGAACLDGCEGLVVAETARQAADQVLVELRSPEYVARRVAAQGSARARFGDDVAYSPLLRSLATSAAATPLAPQARPARVLIQSGGHHENRMRILPLAQAVRRRGHHPIVLVYRLEHVAPFVASGIDAIALHSFDESRAERALRLARIYGIRTFAAKYRGLDLDDLTAVDQVQRPARYESEKRAQQLDDVTRQVDRVLRVLEVARPDQVYVWNGHTGIVANTLRHWANGRGLPTLFLERSILADGLYVDPLGSNGDGELARATRDDLERWDGPAPRGRAAATRTVPVDEVTALRSQGPWSDAMRIVFVPLQVQTDTNVILHSPEIRTMADLVRCAAKRFGGPETAIVVRPHPEEVSPVELPSLPGVHVDSRGSLDAWLEAADLVVTLNSTVGLEALVRNKPVYSAGRGIFVGKGLTDAQTPAFDEVERYWRVLTRRYTVLPEHEPTILDSLLSQAKGSIDPVNPVGLDPDAARRATRAALDELAARARQAKKLHVVVDLRPSDRLDLTYRKTSVEVTRDWVVQRVRDRLELGGDVEVSVGRDEVVDAPTIHVTRGDRATRGPTLDRYGWPLP